MTFNPRFRYEHALVNDLLRIESARSLVEILPLPPDKALRLRLDALQRSTHSSTQIEGNPLDAAAVRKAIAAGPRVGSQAEQEVRNYWRALNHVEDFSAGRSPMNESFIRELHAIVIVRGRGRRGARSDYRPGECPVVDTVSGRIDYGPPEPKDVPDLMKELVSWLGSAQAAELPAVIRAALLAHRFMSIHPFPDGNGRTGRLLATAIIWQSGYRMRGFLSFDEFFNADRAAYYSKLQMGLPVNFYDGRHDPDHEPWLLYFTGVLAKAADELQIRARRLHADRGEIEEPWERLQRPQQQLLTQVLARQLAEPEEAVTFKPGDVGAWFGVSDRTAREWLAAWVAEDLVEPVTPSSGRGERIRRYRLVPRWAELVDRAGPLEI